MEKENIFFRVNHVNVGYTQDIVRDVSFELNPREILAIVGESGSGKSTLLKSLIGRYPGSSVVSKGSVCYKGKNLVEMPKKELSKIRGMDISMVFQSPGATLNPVRKIGHQFIETICYHSNLNKAQAYDKAVDIMKKLGLYEPERIMKSYSFQLSGGMKQRVSISMALAMEPQILLADEPTSALDATVQKTVVKEMMKLRDEFGTAIIIVTHNIMLAAYMADRIAVMYSGELVEIGDKKSLMDSPKHPYTQALIDSVPSLKENREIKGIEGKRIDFSALPQGCLFSNRCHKKSELCAKKHPEMQKWTENHFYACNH